VRQRCSQAIDLELIWQNVAGDLPVKANVRLPAILVGSIACVSTNLFEFKRFLFKRILELPIVFEPPLFAY